jgi:protein TonB
MSSSVLPSDPTGPRRERLAWSGGLAIGLALHGAVLLAFLWRPAVPDVSPPAPAAIMIDLAPAPQPASSPPVPRPPPPTPVKPVPPPKLVVEPKPVTPPLPEVPKAAAIIPHPVEKPAKPVRRHPVEHKIRHEPPPPPVVPAVQPIQGPPVAAKAPPAPQPVAAPAAADPTAVPTWQSALLARFERYKHYPAAARERHQEGTVLLRLVMDRQGRILQAGIDDSSGVPVLDEEVMALVDRVQPLPPPPASLPGDPLTLVVPVRFQLD